MSQQKAVEQVLRKQYDPITREQALTAGMTESALRHRLRAGGPWQIVLPGVYLSRTGPLSGGQREAAAVLYAGRGCVVTGLAALARQGVRVPLTEIVDVLVPHRASRQGAGFVRVHRTTRMPDNPVIIGGIRWHPSRALSRTRPAARSTLGTSGPSLLMRCSKSGALCCNWRPSCAQGHVRALSR